MIGIMVVMLCGVSYHIGNSLTYDSVVYLQPDGITQDAHVDNGRSLSVIWNDPNGVDFVFANPWPTALQQPWDTITMQPHDSGGSTLGDDVIAVSNFMGVSVATSYYVLQTWQRTTNWPSDSWWVAPVPDDLTTPTTKQRSYFDHLMNRLDGVWMVPTGEVFYELEQRGMDPALLYRDTIHASNGIGRYVAAATLESTTKQQHPRNTPTDPGFPIESELLTELRNTIWDVVTSHPWSGYSDFNRDGVVNTLDLVEWETSNRPGNDFLAWQRATSNFQPFTSISEPPTLVLVLALCITRNRWYK